MARKIRIQATICLDCGEELSSGGYCFKCGKNTNADSAPPIRNEGTYLDTPEDDDMPTRASHVFWFDGLLFTEWWYIPATILLTVIAVTLLTIRTTYTNYIGGLLVAIIAGMWVFVLVQKRQRG